MKKIFAVIPVAILIILLSTSENVKADSSHYVILIDTYGGQYRANLYNCATNASFYSYSDTQYKLDHAQGYSIGNVWHASIDAAVAYAKQYIVNLPSITTNSSVYIGKSEPLIILNNVFTLVSADNVYLSFEDYENSLIPPDPSWTEEMWNELREKLGEPEFWFGEWFINLIDSVFGDDENDPTGPPKPPLSTHVTINNPTITPAPTPIPYSTIIVPKTDPVSGDTYYETNYIYNNPSGTPIVVTTPPSQPNSTDGSGNGDDYSPVGGDPYSIPQLSWLTNGVLTDDNNNTIDGIGSIAEGMDSIDTIGSDYTDGMGAVQDATGTLPTSWLLLIGVAAAIPLIAGIVSRFLS